MQKCDPPPSTPPSESPPSAPPPPSADNSPTPPARSPPPSPPPQQQAPYPPAHEPVPPPGAPLYYADHRWQYAPSLHPAHFYPDYRGMPHRVHASDRNSGFVSSAASSYYHSEQVASHHEDPATYQRIHTQPTPPPIATLHHSPAMSTSSLASSSISPSPPITQPSTPYYQQGAPMQAAPAYPYNPNSALGARYDAAPPYATASHPVQVSTRSIRPSYVNSQPYPGQPNYIVHTDDAATKLSDRVRRKCYNCRTTDTSTWRRSSLTPGKVLCNKCGLFERTHSRPRPEQFPHKRGPLVTATFKSSRSPPPTSSRLPPIATHHMHAMPPHHSNHPSIAPLMSRAEQGPTMQQQQQIQGQQNYHNHNASTLPEIRSLLNTPASAGSPASTSSAHESVEQQHEQRAPSPQQGASLDGSPRSDRHDVHAYRAGN